MVSIRCNMVVRSELGRLGLHHGMVGMGEVNIMEDLSGEQRNDLRSSLLRFGLELLDEEMSILIEKIKTIIVEMVHYSEDSLTVSPLDFISQKLDLQYGYISNIFSEVTGTTIENYITLHKIERVKELLLYDDMSLTEIASLLSYGSVAHLSNQFRKVTGLTLTYFKGLRGFRRQITLEGV